MKIARITNDKKVLLADEIIEYPSELEGGRNLLLINTVGRYSGGRIYNLSQFNTDDPYTFETNGPPGNKIGFVGYNLIPGRAMVLSAESDRVEDMKFSIGWYDSVGGYISHGDIGVNNTYIIGDRIFYITKVPKDAYQISVGIGEWPFRTDYTIKKPQLILSNKATDWTPAPEDLGMVYPADVQHFATGFRVDGTMMVREFIEVENRNVFFEDNFEDVDINPLWEVEPFGSNPNALDVGIHEGKFRIINIITGHGSFALSTKLPNVNEGKVIISFDWMSYNKTTNTHYRGSQVVIRKNVLSRANTYGISTYDDNILMIRAYQSENASWNNFVIPSVAYEVSSYNIVLDLDENKISVYNNGALVGVEEKVIDLGGYYLEFAYGGYSSGTYSLIDNVNVIVRENMPMARVRNNVLEACEIVEGGV